MNFKKLLGLMLSGFMLVPALAFASTGSSVTGMMGLHMGTNSTATTVGMRHDPSPSTMSVKHAASVSARVTTGTVASISGTTITLTATGGTSYSVDASSAKFLRKYGSTMAITDIQSGDTLRVSGTVSGSNITATSIRDMSQQQKNASFSGSVTSVNGNSFSLQTKSRGTQTVNTDSSTTFKELGQTSVSMSNIVNGENVDVSGVWDSTASTVAASIVTIVVKTETITGTLTSVSGTTLTVTSSSTNSTTYTVDASSVKKIARRYGAATTVSELQVGDSLQVRGLVNGDSVTASTVRDMSLQARSGTFVGTVTALNGSSFTLQSKARGSQTINTTSTTVFRQGSQASGLSAIALGQTVTVSGVWDRTNSNVTATRVTIKVSSLTVSGVLQAISGTALTVVNASSTSYSVDASKARVRFEHSHSGALSNFQVNDQVKVWGSSVSGSTNITATIVQDLSRTYNSTSTAVSVTTSGQQ